MTTIGRTMNDTKPVDPQVVIQMLLRHVADLTLALAIAHAQLESKDAE